MSEKLCLGFENNTQCRDNETGRIGLFKWDFKWNDFIKFSWKLKPTPLAPSGMHTHLAHLANTASLTEGADSPHIALIPGAKLGWVVVGGGIQGNAWVHVPGGLQVVALTEQRERQRKARQEWDYSHKASQLNIIWLINKHFV